MLAINAIADTTKIEAAILALPPNVKRLAAAADLNLVGKISVFEIDKKLSASDRMSVLDKLALKIGLEKSGFLGD